MEEPRGKFKLFGMKPGDKFSLFGIPHTYEGRGNIRAHWRNPEKMSRVGDWFWWTFLVVFSVCMSFLLVGRSYDQGHGFPIMSSPSAWNYAYEAAQQRYRTAYFSQLDAHCQGAFLDWGNPVAGSPQTQASYEDFANCMRTGHSKYNQASMCHVAAGAGMLAGMGAVGEQTKNWFKSGRVGVNY